MEQYELVIYDPEDEEQVDYKLNLNETDYLRAQEDEVFLNSLLIMARNENTQNLESSEVENTAEAEPTEPEHIEEQSLLSSCTLQNTSSTLQLNLDVPKKSGGVWEYNQTKDLIRSMATHILDLNNVKKRKFVFQNVANDLLSLGYPFTASAVQNKWKSLVRSYQKCKDTQTRTGQGPSRFYFFQEMDEILGTKPTNQCSHSLNSAFESEVSVNETINVEENKNEATVTEQDEETTSGTTSHITKKKKYIATKMQYMSKKMKEYERKETHKQKMEIEERRLEIENKKLELLSKFLEKKREQ